MNIMEVISKFGTLLRLVMVVILIESCDQDSSNVSPDSSKNDSTDLNNDSTIITDTIITEVDTVVHADTTTCINGIFTIVNGNSGKVLNVAHSSTQNGANIVQWTSTLAENQKWEISRDDGHYKIISVSSGLALSADKRDTLNGVTIVQQTYLNLASQQWDIAKLENGNYRITNVKSGKDLDVLKGMSFDGADIIQWKNKGTLSQEWALTDGEGSSANGQLKWTWVSSNVPEDSYLRITAAMNAAVERYNHGANWWDRTLTVEYNQGVPTADAVISGHIRFGSQSGSQNERTALHEIAHTFGIGSSWRWDTLLGEGGAFVGEYTNQLIKEYDGVDANIWTGGGHFWPYGLNYNTEWSEENARRHVELVSSMVQDGVY
jgi:hypothetical protein